MILKLEKQLNKERVKHVRLLPELFPILHHHCSVIEADMTFYLWALRNP
jgi:hypothetical protein